LGDGLGALDVQEMADTLDGAVLDLREPGVEQGPAFDEQLHSLGAEDREDRLGGWRPLARVRTPRR